MNLLCAKKTDISFSALPVPRRNGNVRPNSFCILLCARTGILDQNLQHSASQCKSHSVQSEPKFAPPQGRFALWISSHDLGGRLKLQISLFCKFASRLATNSIAFIGWSKMFSVLSCRVLFPPYELSTVSMNCTCEILRSGGSRAKQCKTQLRLNLAKAASAAYLAWYHVHP